MPGILSTQAGQDAIGQVVAPAMQQIGPVTQSQLATRGPQVVSKKDDGPTIGGTLAFSGIAGAMFNAPAAYSAHKAENASKSVASLGRVARAGVAARSLLAGAGAGALVTAPIDYIQQRLAKKYENDQEFKASHFGAMLLPAAASAVYGTGAFMNTANQIKNSGKQGTIKTVKNILSPTNNIKAAHKEVSNLRALFSGGKAGIGKGLLTAGLMGLSMIEPVSYAVSKLKKKNGDNMEKTASAKGKFSHKLATRLILGGATVAAGERLYHKRKKQLKLSAKSMLPRPMTEREMYELSKGI